MKKSNDCKGSNDRFLDEYIEVACLHFAYEAFVIIMFQID